MAQASQTPTSSLYDAIVATFGGAGASGSEKREQPRFSVDGRATIIPCSGPDARKPMKAAVRDASPSGIAIILGLPLRVGDRFLVVLDKTRAVLCEVMNWNPIESGNFRIGGRYVAELRTDGGGAAKTPAAVPRPASQPAPSGKQVPASGSMQRQSATAGSETAQQRYAKRSAPELSRDEIFAVFKSPDTPDVINDDEVRQLEARLESVQRGTPA